MGLVDALNAVRVHPALDMDEGLGKIGVLRLVHAPVGADEPPGGSGDEGVFHEGVVENVDGALGIPAQIHIAVAAVGIPLLGKQGVKDEGVFSVIVQAPVTEGRIVLRGKQHRFPGVLDVVQQSVLFIVHIHHGGLVRGGDGIVVAVVAQGLIRDGLLKLRPALAQPVGILQPHAEQILGILNVLHPRLPEQVENIHLFNGDVPQTAQPLRVPEHAVDPGAGLELVPPYIAPGLLEIVLPQHHRQNGAEHPGLGPIGLLPGQHDGLGIGVHRVGMLAQNGVDQPAGGRLDLPLPVGADALPVPQLPELLGLDDPLFKLPLSVPVPGQNFRQLLQPLPGDFLLGGFRLRLFLFHAIPPDRLPWVKAVLPLPASKTRRSRHRQPPRCAGSRQWPG